MKHPQYVPTQQKLRNPSPILRCKPPFKRLAEKLADAGEDYESKRFDGQALELKQRPHLLWSPVFSALLRFGVAFIIASARPPAVITHQALGLCPT